MNIDATFWVAVSFVIFCVGIIYLKVPQKINSSLNNIINSINNEIKDAEELNLIREGSINIGGVKFLLN